MRTRYESCVLDATGKCTRFSHIHENYLTPEDYQAQLKTEAEAHFQHWFITTNDDYTDPLHHGFIVGYLKGRSDG